MRNHLGLDTNNTRYFPFGWPPESCSYSTSSSTIQRVLFNVCVFILKNMNNKAKKPVSGSYWKRQLSNWKPVIFNQLLSFIFFFFFLFSFFFFFFAGFWLPFHVAMLRCWLNSWFVSCSNHGDSINRGRIEKKNKQMERMNYNKCALHDIPYDHCRCT